MRQTLQLYRLSTYISFSDIIIETFSYLQSVFTHMVARNYLIIIIILFNDDSKIYMLMTAVSSRKLLQTQKEKGLIRNKKTDEIVCICLHVYSMDIRV